MHEVMRHFGTREQLRLWRANSGAALSPDGNRIIKFGVAGQADLSGIIRSSGRRLEIEIKTATGRQSVEQKRFQEMIERFGGIYVLARSPDDVYAALSAAGIDLPVLAAGGGKC
jgi:hypothetical protein